LISFNIIIVNIHTAVVSILTFPMILHLTCEKRMREITGCTNTGAKTVWNSNSTRWGSRPTLPPSPSTQLHLCNAGG